MAIAKQKLGRYQVIDTLLSRGNRVKPLKYKKQFYAKTINQYKDYEVFKDFSNAIEKILAVLANVIIPNHYQRIM